MPINPPFGVSAMGPPLAWAGVTMSDTVDLPRRAYAIRSTAAGSIKVTCGDDTTTVMNFEAGETRPGQVKRIWANGGATIVEANLEVAYQTEAPAS